MNLFLRFIFSFSIFVINFDTLMLMEDITKKIKTLIKEEIRNEPWMASKSRQSQKDANEPERRKTSMEDEAAAERGVYEIRKDESKTGKTIHRGATESRRNCRGPRRSKKH